MSECETIGMKKLILIVFCPPKNSLYMDQVSYDPFNSQTSLSLCFLLFSIGSGCIERERTGFWPIRSGMCGIHLGWVDTDSPHPSTSSLKSVCESDKATNTAGRFLSQRGLERVRPYREISVTKGRLTVFVEECVLVLCLGCGGPLCGLKPLFSSTYRLTH